MRPCLLNSCAACATPSLTPPNPSDRSARHWQSTLHHQLQSLKQMSQTPLQSSPPCPPIAFAEVLPHIYKSTTDDERATIWTTGKDGWHGAALAVVMPHTVCWRGSRGSALAALEGARR